MCDVLLAIIDDVIREEQCFSIKDLAIDGNDIIKLGIPEGVEIGRVLRSLLDKVINNELVNETETLKRWVLENEKICQRYTSTRIVC